MQDKITLKDIRIFAHHGDTEKERREGQWFEFDLEIGCNLRIAGISDNLKDTYDFRTLYEVVENATLKQEFHLIESLGDKICRQIHRLYPEVTVCVRIRKPESPLQKRLSFTEVEIVRGPRVEYN